MCRRCCIDFKALQDILGSSGEMQLNDVNNRDSDDDDIDNTNTSSYQRQRRNYKKPSTSSCFQDISNMLKHAPTRRALLLGCGLMVLQQLSGINTVMYYAASIYEMSGFDEKTAIWLSGFTALAQVTGVLVSLHLIEKKGRRPLVLTSLFFVTLSLIGLGGSFFMARISSAPITQPSIDTNNDCSYQKALVWNGITSYCYDCTLIEGCGFCNGICTEGNKYGPADANICTSEYSDNTKWRFEGCDDQKYGSMSVSFMVLYLLSFGIAMGPLPWTINSEIYPLEYRSLAVSCSTAINWIGNFLVSATFLTISSPTVLTSYGAFWLYGSVALAGLVWIYFALPETKGMSLEEIEELFRRPGDNTHTSGLSAAQKELLARNTFSGGGH